MTYPNSHIHIYQPTYMTSRPRYIENGRQPTHRVGSTQEEEMRERERDREGVRYWWEDEDEASGGTHVELEENVDVAAIEGVSEIEGESEGEWICVRLWI